MTAERLETTATIRKMKIEMAAANAPTINFIGRVVLLFFDIRKYMWIILTGSFAITMMNARRGKIIGKVDSCGKY